MGENKKVLIIEDEQIIANSLKEYLVKLGYDADVAKNGEEGLEKASTYEPDLILLDILLPEMDGITLLGKLQENPKTKDIEVLVLTNLQDREEAVKEINKTARYLFKAEHSLKEVAEEIKEILD
jgi:DNA-binding response OmpR family regulator